LLFSDVARHRTTFWLLHLVEQEFFGMLDPARLVLSQTLAADLEVVPDTVPTFPVVDRGILLDFRLIVPRASLAAQSELRDTDPIASP
jgi:hypothetical protein